MRHYLLSILAFAGATTPAAAQAPTLTAAYPPGIQAGAAAQVSLAGANLKDVVALVASGAGITIEKADGGDDKNLPVKIAATPDAAPGVREIRVVTKNGVSNAARIWVGLWPDRLEKEPNDALDQAEALEKLPATVNGRLDKATDVDSYRFHAKAGETWVFSLNAADLYSETDGHLVLRDKTGRQLAYSLDTFGRDPVLIHEFDKPGEYVLSVRDSLYRGGPNFTYRLTVGQQPRIVRYVPMGGRRGTEVRVRVAGVNLGSTEEVRVTLPDDEDEDLHRFVPRVGEGLANPIDLVVSDMVEIGEWEPNDTVATAMRYSSYPLAVGGFMERDGDRDVLAFNAKAKQRVAVQIQTKRLGSRMHGILRILDSTGKVLANNDGGATGEPSINFEAPSDGVFFAEVSDLSGSSGDGFHYRLVLSDPAPPDFALRVEPDNLSVPANASLPVTVFAERAGYAGEIALAVENLPAGVTATPPPIPAGQNSVTFTLNAAGDATGWKAPRIIGTARIGEREVRHRARGAELYQPPLTTDAALKVRRGTELLLAAVAPAPPFTFQVEAPAASLKQGEKLEWKVKIQRKEGYAEEITFTAGALPANVKVDAVKVDKDKNEATVTLQAEKNAAAGPASIYLQGAGKGATVFSPSKVITVEKAG